jgi:hypothetical protein
MNQRASTRAEAEAQTFTVPPTYDGWHQFAALLDGYAVLKDMGIENWGEWHRAQLDAYDKSGSWQTDLVGLRILLFLTARGMRFAWGAEPFDRIDSLLHEIAGRTGQRYTTDTAIRERVLNDTSNMPIIGPPKPDEQ